MRGKEYWTSRPSEDIERTAREMNELCWHGECPITIDASSGCPVMELCNKPCAEIREADWMRWLECERGETDRRLIRS